MRTIVNKCERWRRYRGCRTHHLWLQEHHSGRLQPRSPRSSHLAVRAHQRQEGCHRQPCAGPCRWRRGVAASEPTGRLALVPKHHACCAQAFKSNGAPQGRARGVRPVCCARRAAGGGLAVQDRAVERAASDRAGCGEPAAEWDRGRVVSTVCWSSFFGFCVWFVGLPPCKMKPRLRVAPARCRHVCSFRARGIMCTVAMGSMSNVPHLLGLTSRGSIQQTRVR